MDVPSEKMNAQQSGDEELFELDRTCPQRSAQNEEVM